MALLCMVNLKELLSQKDWGLEGALLSLAADYVIYDFF